MDNFEYACIARKEPTNRREKKLVFKELDKNLEIFLNIEAEFLEQLLLEDENDNSYQDLYKHYLHKWNQTIEYLYNNKKFKYTLPNGTYFKDKFGPVEKEKVN